MSLANLLVGDHDESLPPKIERSEDEQKHLEGRLLRAAFAVAAISIVALYAADSFVRPQNNSATYHRVAPAPVM